MDVQGAGLGDLGKPEGFLERQTEAWISRYDKAKTEEIEEVGPLTDWLSRDVPGEPASHRHPQRLQAQQPRLESGRPDGGKRAVLDWEMATVGDPLFDLAVSLSYWIEPDDPDELKAVMPTVTVTPGFMTRREFIDRYETESGRDLSDMHWYVVFGYFKLAAILQQIFARWKKARQKTSASPTSAKRVQHPDPTRREPDPNGRSLMERIGVLGTGTMGAGIVQLAAQSGYRVTACDTSVEALERAQVYVREGLARFAEKSAFSEDEASSHYDRIHWTTNPEDLAEAEAAIEAIVEKVEPKKEALGDAGQATPAPARSSSPTPRPSP